MSWRVWLGEGKEGWADWNRCDYLSLRALAQQCKWRTPLKIMGPKYQVDKLCKILMDDHDMDGDHIMCWVDGKPEDYDPPAWKDDHTQP